MYKEVYPLEIRQGFSLDGLCVLILYNPDRHRNIPMMIGQHDAEMIMLEREREQAKRPQTHQLIETILDQFGMEIKEVTIDRFDEGLFYATLHISDGFNIKKVDCRASDAIVLALRAEIAIKMADSVVEDAGYPAENDEEKDDNPTIDKDIRNEAESIETLEALLQEYEQKEEYEKAAELAERIDRLKHDRNSTNK